MNKHSIVLGLVLSALISLPTEAALNGYLTVIGKTQGEIKGSSTQKGRENQIVVFGFTHGYKTLPDPSSCLPGDLRSHSPLTVVKEIERASNGLTRAWMNREPLTVTLRLWRPSMIGSEEQYFTIALENALISGIQRESLNNRDSTLQNFPTMERISFTYEKITQTWNPNPDEVVDIWTAQCSKLDAISDLNLDGVVNLLDFAILADQWLMQF